VLVVVIDVVADAVPVAVVDEVDKPLSVTFIVACHEGVTLSPK